MKLEFVSDMYIPDVQEVVLVRASCIGKLVHIEVSDLPEGYAFFSSKDIPGKKNIKIFNYEIPLFAETSIQFIGQAVGIVVGPDKKQAMDLAQNIHIVVEAEDNGEENDLTSFPLLSERSFTRGEPDGFFVSSEGVVQSSFTFEPKYHHRSEPSCVKVQIEKNNIYKIAVATQWPFSVAESVADVLNVPKRNIDIISGNFGEHNNSLVWFPSLLACQCAIASALTGKNTCIHFSRIEDYKYTTASPRVIVTHKSVVSDFEKILATDISVLIDAGAFNPVIDEMILQMLTVASSIYEIPHLHISVKAYNTNSKPTDFFGGLGENFVLNSLENHINEIALNRHISPVEFRLENIYKEKKIIGGKVSINETYDFASVLKEVCKASDYHRKYHAYKCLNEQSQEDARIRLRGIGLATGLQYSGINSFIKRGINYYAEMTLTTEGKAVVTLVDCPGDLRNMFAKKIASQLGIEEENILFINADEKNFNIIKTMENNILYLTSLIQKCCDSMERLRFRNPLPITVKKKFQVSKTKDWNPITLEGTPFVSETAGACVVELELNPIMYTLKIKSVWLSIAPGAVFHKSAIIEKIKKEIQNCISQLTIEDSLRHDFFQFRLLTIEEVPDIYISILQSEEKNALYKGVENIANNLLPAAFTSAVEQIFITNSDFHFSLPLTKEKIYDAILQTRNYHSSLVQEKNADGVMENKEVD